MSQPITKKSVDAATAATTGADTRSLGHYQITLFVAAKNLDTANDTLSVAIEGSPNRIHWSNVGQADSAKRITDSDLTEDPDNPGVYTASVISSPNFHEFIRARVTDFADASGGDLEVDAWVMAAGNAGQGRKGTARSGPVTEL